MKFLIDAHLPRQLANLLQVAGHDAIHTLDLPEGNRTSDTQIREYSMLEQCVVVTKDADFVDSFFVQHQPWKLLLVSTGNIRNTELLALFMANMEQLLIHFDSFDFIEVSRTDIIIHL